MLKKVNQTQEDSDELLFLEEEENVVLLTTESTSAETLESWKILLVDDDREIHEATKLAIGDLSFDGKSLQFFSAYSSREAQEILAQHSDIATIFLDVIMETEETGLEIVKYVREDLNNELVRIILCTGQPGKVPEDRIIVQYDINDYTTKTELTRQKLLTKVITSLRGYRTLVNIEQSNQKIKRYALENEKLCKQLEEYANNLEKKVEKRTQELINKNQQLEIEIQQRKLVETQLERANRELLRFATLDGLTQVANRYYFDIYLKKEWQRMRREQMPISLILCDVDYFKLYNDRYGHLAGDECLKTIAKSITQVVNRPADLVARYGGEEFAIILPNTEREGAIQVAKNIQSSIQNLQILHQDSLIKAYISLSLGINTCLPSDTLEVNVLIDCADRALYQSKNQGRDRLCVYQ